jgi:hypothetical protein
MISALSSAARWGLAIAAPGALAAIDPTQVTATIATAVTTVVVGWLGFRQHRADNARTSDRLDLDRTAERTDATLRLIDQLQEQLNAEIAQRTADRQLIASQSTEIGLLRRELAELHVGVVRLTAQLVDHGIAPLWQPPPPGGATF